MTEKIYTLPHVIESKDKYLMTGNQWVAIPSIRETDGSIEGVNCTSMQAKGLIEFRGAKDNPFIKPILMVDGVNEAGDLNWQKQVQWIPSFTANDSQWTGIILTPPDVAGFYYSLKYTNKTAKQVQVTMGWQLSWGQTVQLIFNDHLLGCTNRVFRENWTNSLVLEARGQTGLAALAFFLGHEPLNLLEVVEGSFANGTSEIKAMIAGSIELPPGASWQLDLPVAINSEADGAAVTAVNLKRLTFAKSHSQTLAWLNEKKQRVVTKPAGEKTEKILLRNLFFNYFYSTSKTIDTNELVMLTSRSNRYYVSGAFWARDAFLWSFPAMALIDQKKALEMLEVGFTRYLKNGPYHSLYIDGAILYPGFELDQLAAFFLAVERYHQLYGDLPWQASWLVQGAKQLEEILWQHHDQKLYLFSTFLDPSDDPVEYPYLTYSNALILQAITVLQMIYKANSHNTKVRHLDGAARLLKKAINQHCVVYSPKGPMYAWAVDGKGNYQLYDNPTGSLQLLPFYKFCSPKDKIWQNTMNWIYSHHNQYAYLDTKIKGFGGVHVAAPWVLGACNSLLAGKVKEGLELLGQSDLDNGYACETVNPQHGGVHTGAAFATCGGFLAYALSKTLAEQGLSI